MLVLFVFLCSFITVFTKTLEIMLYCYLSIKAVLIELQMKGLVTPAQIVNAIEQLDKCVEWYKSNKFTKLGAINDLAKLTRILIEDDLYCKEVEEQVDELKEAIIIFV